MESALELSSSFHTQYVTEHYLAQVMTLCLFNPYLSHRVDIRYLPL